MKYHINSKGVPSVCRANKKPCPFGGSDNHFDNIEDAQIFADKLNQEKYGLLGNTSTIHDKPLSVQELTSEKVTFNVNNLTKEELDDKPFLTSEMDSITVTRGKDHVLTVLNKDGSTHSFRWGENYVESISKDSKDLMKYVIDYSAKNGVYLDITNEDIVKARTFKRGDKHLLILSTDDGQEQVMTFDSEMYIEDYIDTLDFKLDKTSERGVSYFM